MRERDSKMGNIRDGSQQAMRASMNYQGGLLIIPNCQSLFKKKNKLPITNGRDSEAPWCLLVVDSLKSTRKINNEWVIGVTFHTQWYFWNNKN